MMDKLRESISKWLDADAREYQQRIHNNRNNLYKHIRKGDVVLVEGRSKISQIIKLFSNSHWSHVAIYIGDELIKKGQPFRDKYLKLFGKDAEHLVIEAFPGKGVIASPLQQYIDYNIRICRPFRIKGKDLQLVIRDVIGNLHRRYDQENIIDLALMLLPAWINPFRKRTARACLGSCNEFQVICSGMIARAFQKVGFPVIPELTGEEENHPSHEGNPFGATLIMRHYSQILPRDFDLSPTFEIIKFNIIAGRKFRYKSLPWDTGVDGVEITVVDS